MPKEFAVTLGKYGEHYAGSTGFIAEWAVGDYAHSFGGSSWNVIGCQGSWDAPVELLALDLQDPRLSLQLQGGIAQLPLVSYVNLSVMPQRQTYHINQDQRQVNVFHVSDGDSEMLEERHRLPTPFPSRRLALREMKPSELPVDEASYWTACDSFAGGEAFIRVAGPPVWMQGVEEIKCRSCSGEMEYIASIGYENYAKPCGLLPDSVPFFLGEFASYFFLCGRCMQVEVACQST
jgi:hypothetical protein